MTPAITPELRERAGKDRPLAVLDLFSGIGGFSLGLERTGGFKTVAFCEIELFPRRVLAKHWPEVPCYDDVRTLTADRLRADGIAVDIICGGFPCQDISESNTRGAGLDGERSGLWFEYWRLLGEVRPTFAVVENTAALLGRGLDRVLGGLAQIGYDAEWHSIPASALGAPHDRDRVWIVAYPAQTQRGQIVRDRDLARQYCLLSQRAEDASRAAGVPEEAWSRPWRSTADHVRGLDDGIPCRLDGFNALANAVVPQIPELIGRAILASLDAPPASPLATGEAA
ncbi:UNVERIFIED_ORG: DNA (cytosine-5)-methyltransferase 1 [Methylorubrum zatmanii]